MCKNINMGNLKKCKGIHKLTYGYGCENLVSNDNKNRVYGLGKLCGCFQKWIKTDNGEKYVNKNVLPRYKKKDNKFSYAKEVEKKSSQNYRANVLQPLINQIIHRIDHNQNCIVKGVRYKENDAGHFYGVGSNETLALNIHNIFLQSVRSNRNDKIKDGGTIEYLNGLINTFGKDYADFIIKLAQHKPLKLTKHELKNKAKICRLIIKELDSQQGKVYTKKERILLRNKYNLMIDCYDLEYSYYEV